MSLTAGSPLSDRVARHGTSARALAPGVLLAFVVAAAATFLSEHHGAPLAVLATVLLTIL